MVYLTKAHDGDIHGAIDRLVDQLNFPETLGKRLGIKLNLCDYRRPCSGCTTDPLVLDGLLNSLRKKYPREQIYVFENDATGTLADNLFLWLGYQSITSRYDVPFVNLAHESWTPVRIDGYHFKEVEVPTVLLESVIINHPKLKTHGRTKVTCGLKNMFGCYRIKQKDRYHAFLDEAIVDINMAIKCDYTIVDGFLCLEGNRGPTQGYPKKLGVFVGGSDIVSVDAFCSKLMGFSPSSIRHLKLSAAKKVGSIEHSVTSEVDDKSLSQMKFNFSRSKYYLMQTLRKVVKP